MGGIGIYGPRPGDTTTPTPTTFTGGFDYVIQSRDDLVSVVAPVAGVFTLPNGAYSIRGIVFLNAGERLAVPGGGVVLMFGTTGSGFIGTVNSPNALLTTSGFFDSIGLFFFNSGGTGPGARQSGGIATAYRTAFFSDGAASTGFEMQASGVVLKANTAEFSGDGAGIHMIGGRAYVEGCTFSVASGGVNGACVKQDGAVLLKRFFATDCEFVHTGTNPTVHMDSLLGNVNIVNSLMAPQTAGVPIVVLAQAKTLCLGAGNILRNVAGGVPVGVSVQGQVGTIDVDHITCEGLSFTVQHVAGVVGNAKVIGVDQDGGTALIDWAAANIPTNGLLAVGNTTASAAMFQGFVATDARVNVKANSFAGALASETPIVP